MKLTLKLLNAFFVSCIPCAIFAQGIQEFYQATKSSSDGIGLRAGTNCSYPTVTSAVDRRTNTTTTLTGVAPRFGYYVSGFMYKDLIPNQLSFRLDATLQMKGVGAEHNGQATVKANYYYFGLSPQVGLRLVNHFTVYVGAEANTLISKMNPWGKTYPLEFGGLIRFTYQIGHYGLEAGYFKGVTKYDTFVVSNLPGPAGLSNNDFYNQNVQLGLFYKLSR